MTSYDKRYGYDDFKVTSCHGPSCLLLHVWLSHYSCIMALPSISVTKHSNSDGVPVNDEHVHRRRVFVGPMPEKVVSHTEAQALKRKKRGLFRITTAQEEDDMEIIKQNAFKFFVHTGGRPEEWGEDQERNIRQEMLQRWRNSEWGTVWGSRRKKEPHDRSMSYWVGGSFEIGHFLGVDVLQESGNSNTGNRPTNNLSTQIPSTSNMQSHTNGEPRPSTTTQGAFVSARSHLPSLSSPEGDCSTELGPSSIARKTIVSASSDFLPPSLLDIDKGTPYISRTPSAGSSVQDTSSTSLLGPSLGQAQTDVPRSIIKMPTFPASASANGRIQGNSKGKGRPVRYADIPEQETSDSASPSSPALPAEVMGRHGEAIEGTSAEATSSGILSPKPASLDWGDIVMRGNVIEYSRLCTRILSLTQDRMLIRMCYTRTESIKPPFDEAQNRTTRNIQYADWAEYMVAWRKDRVEIYEDHVRCPKPFNIMP